MSIGISWKDTTRFAEFRTTKVGRKILSRALSKTAVTGKAQGKKLILQVYALRSASKIKLYSTRAKETSLVATIGASSTDPRGKTAIPLHEFKFEGHAPTAKHGKTGSKKAKNLKPLTGEIIRGQPSLRPGGFIAFGANSGKKLTLKRAGREQFPTKTIQGPSAGQMLTNTRVVDPLFTTLGERLPVVLEQEVTFAMDFESDKGKEVSTDDVD